MVLLPTRARTLVFRDPRCSSQLLAPHLHGKLALQQASLGCAARQLFWSLIFKYRPNCQGSLQSGFRHYCSTRLFLSQCDLHSANVMTNFKFSSHSQSLSFPCNTFCLWDNTLSQCGGFSSAGSSDFGSLPFEMSWGSVLSPLLFLFLLQGRNWQMLSVRLVETIQALQAIGSLSQLCNSIILVQKEPESKSMGMVVFPQSFIYKYKNRPQAGFD